jgi:hypothetical protein
MSDSMILEIIGSTRYDVTAEEAFNKLAIKQLAEGFEVRIIYPGYIELVDNEGKTIIYRGWPSDMFKMFMLVCNCAVILKYDLTKENRIHLMSKVRDVDHRNKYEAIGGVKFTPQIVRTAILAGYGMTDNIDAWRILKQAIGIEEFLFVVQWAHEFKVSLGEACEEVCGAWLS